MADRLAASRADFQREWIGSYVARQTGVFPTLEANVAHVCRALGLSVDRERTAEAAWKFESFSRRTFVARSDAVGTLARLKEMDLRIGLITDCGPQIPALWAASPMAPHVDMPVFSCLAGIKKPDPRIYHLACQGLEVAPGRCLYVGDGSSRELTGALGVGMTPVLIRPPSLDLDDDFRIDGEEWDGARVAALGEVVALVQ